MRQLWKIGTASVVGGLLFLLASSAHAIPTLQLYVEGATYDTASESWTLTADRFTIWVLGDVGAYGTIYDVKLSVAFPAGLDPANIEIVPVTATAGLLPGPGDPSTPAAPTLVASPLSAWTSSGPCGSHGTVGTIPCRGDGKTLAQHGEFGAGTQWIEYYLGDLSATDSPIGDFVSAFPAVFPSTGQINAYRVTVNANPAVAFPPGTELHFDAFDHIVQHNGKTKVVFAPFSHDATVTDAPEPATHALMLAAALGLAALARPRVARRRSRG